MGLQHYTQDMSRIPLKYHKKCCFAQSIHTLRLSVGGRTDGRTDARMHGRTDGRKIFTQYSGISSCSVGSTYMSLDCLNQCLACTNFLRPLPSIVSDGFCSWLSLCGNFQLSCWHWGHTLTVRLHLPRCCVCLWYKQSRARTLLAITSIGTLCPRLSQEHLSWDLHDQ